MKNILRHFEKILCCGVMAFLALSIGVSSASAAGNFQAIQEYTSGDFSDVPAGAWYETSVASAYEYGLVEGIGDGKFAPNSQINLASAVTLASRIYSSYVGDGADFSGGDPWYKPYYDYAVENKIINSDVFSVSDMSKKATRYQIASIFANTLPDSEYAAINTVTSGAIPDVPDDSLYLADVYRLYRAGIMTGDDYHKFNGSSYITRSEISAVVTRLAGLQDRKSLTLTIEIPAEKTITVGGKNIYLGMQEAELTSLMGEPDEKLQSIYGYPWYVYGTDDYKNFFYVGVNNSKVVYICSSGPGFSYMGYKMGDIADYSPVYNSEYGVTLNRDSNDNNILHTVVLRDYTTTSTYDDSELASDNEAKMCFHLTNAFRAYHGVVILKWSEPMAETAKNYSTRMVNEGFFSHSDPDGGTFLGRILYVVKHELNATLKSGGENILSGASNAPDAMFWWINSSGHRKNMINKNYTYLGVGKYKGTWTQDFFSLKTR